MEYKGKERRRQPRSYVEPYDTGTYLEFRQDGKSYRFNLLDTSPKGMGMLIKMETAEVLRDMGIGDHIMMEYKTAEASMVMDFEVRHISRITRGRYKGHHQVGLSLISGPKRE